MVSRETLDHVRRGKTPAHGLEARRANSPTRHISTSFTLGAQPNDTRKSRGVNRPAQPGEPRCWPAVYDRRPRWLAHDEDPTGPHESPSEFSRDSRSTKTSGNDGVSAAPILGVPRKQ